MKGFFKIWYIKIQSLELTDSVFKKLDHCDGEIIIKSNGKNLIKVYSPDLSLKKGDLVYILENERKTDRKAFLGDIVKAAHYCDISDYTVTLIIIMKETSIQTTVIQISQHIKKYFHWMKSKGILSLTDIIVMSDTEYKKSIENNEIISCEDFLGRSISCL
ncbi:hypothetical protein ACFWM3_19305 [Gottfriedia sp. NPDC058432]|uniref:hypothetical protein n=1 Tax=Gottfriedia sp. NPDC058432 TaxID=3346497 RepID=UPI0036503D75